MFDMKYVHSIFSDDGYLKITEKYLIWIFTPKITCIVFLILFLLIFSEKGDFRIRCMYLRLPTYQTRKIVLLQSPNQVIHSLSNTNLLLLQ